MGPLKGSEDCCSGQALANISVCINTYKRQQQLSCLLGGLQVQYTGNFFNISRAVAGDDHERSMESVVAELSGRSGLPIKYRVEPIQNIARARNKAIEDTKGIHIAFIDADELPDDYWLSHLFRTLLEYGADAVLGPMLFHYQLPPPKWVLRGKFLKSRYTGREQASIGGKAGGEISC